MAGLYETLAEIHAHDGPISNLWRKTAREESNHAAQFSLLLEAMPEAALRAIIDMPMLESLRLAVENTGEEFRLRSPSVRDALVAAIDFEETMDRIHADQAVVFADPRCRQMFRAMMAADSGHIRQLRAALSELGQATPQSSRARRGPRRPG